MKILGVEVEALPVKDELAILLASVAYKNGIPVRNVLRGERTRPLVKIRREFCKAARKLGYSLPVIARALGFRNHTSVLYLVRTCRARRDRQP